MSVIHGKDTPDKNPKILILGCGMLAREILDILDQPGLGHVTFRALPAQLHFNPRGIVPALQNAVDTARRNGIDHIFIAYADCGTGGLIDQFCAENGVERIAGPHCFAFYQGDAMFEAHQDDDITAFYMTDFLCRHFQNFFIKPLSIDRHPELIEAYFSNYTTLVYLAQSEDDALETVAKDAAALLGLAYEKRSTGYGALTPAIHRASTLPQSRSSEVILHG